MSMNILIVGANFLNKGAQSMLFVTVDEIRKRLSPTNIYFASTDKCDLSDYRFTSVYFSQEAKSLALHRSYFASFLKAAAKDCVKLAIGRRQNLWRCSELKKIIADV